MTSLTLAFATGPNAILVSVVAVCRPSLNSVTRATATVDIPPGGALVRGTASCPAGTVVYGGGTSRSANPVTNNPEAIPLLDGTGFTATFWVNHPSIAAQATVIAVCGPPVFA
ncbi:MAG: hypothetical protein AB7R89_30250 [Dehalococcoidia bacterium]